MKTNGTKTSRFLSIARVELFAAFDHAQIEAMTPEQRCEVFGYLLLLEDDIKEIRKAMNFNQNNDSEKFEREDV